METVYVTLRSAGGTLHYASRTMLTANRPTNGTTILLALPWFTVLAACSYSFGQRICVGKERSTQKS